MATRRARLPMGNIMAIYFATKTPKKLLAAYKKAVDGGHVATWSYDSDGDFTHTADQWNKKAWLRPKIKEGTALVFYILKPEDDVLSSAIYAVYHGRFIETMLRHCDGLFDSARATAMPEDGGDVT
jgi:hypothetical protein